MYKMMYLFDVQYGVSVCMTVAKFRGFVCRRNPEKSSETRTSSRDHVMLFSFFADI